jgi:hypothetical protein
MMMRRRYRRRRQSQRLKNTQKTIRQPAPQLSPVPSPPSTPEQSDSVKHNYPNNDSDTSLDIHYRANSNHRPEMGESNAESALRQENIEKDVTRMKKERAQRRHKKTHDNIGITNNVQEITSTLIQTNPLAYNLYPSSLTQAPLSP